MARKDRYGRYQGRKESGVRSFLKSVIVALVILLVLLLAAGIFLQDYLVYTDNGVKLTLPWAEGDTEKEPPAASKSPVPIIIEGDGEESGGDEPEESVKPDLSGPLHAVLVSQTSLMAGTAAEQVTLAGGNAVILNMKNDDGTLSYVSDVRLAIAAETSGSDPAVNEAIKELTMTEDGLYTIARVSCFRDDLMCRRRSDLAILTSGGYLWLDHDDTRWISPIQKDVTEYLTAICVELAELGFDEILLTSSGYPGHQYDQLHWITGGNAYPEDGLLEPVVADFLSAMRTALEPYGVKLSVEAAGKELAGETALTGLTMENVLAYCDRFWLDAATAEKYANFAAAGEENPAEKLVTFSTAPGAEDAPWAILN